MASRRVALSGNVSLIVTFLYLSIFAGDADILLVHMHAVCYMRNQSGCHLTILSRANPKLEDFFRSSKLQFCKVSRQSLENFSRNPVTSTGTDIHTQTYVANYADMFIGSQQAVSVTSVSILFPRHRVSM